MGKEKEMIAVCGLECHTCDIREAAHDPRIAQEIADWFKKELNQDVKPEDIHCMGCKEDRSRHWSADCWILQCCVDQKGFEYCHQCGEFPCGKLTEWSKTSKRYGEALDRLRRMGQGQKS
jgi:hypothetical protein